MVEILGIKVCVPVSYGNGHGVQGPADGLGFTYPSAWDLPDQLADQLETALELSCREPWCGGGAKEESR